MKLLLLVLSAAMALAGCGTDKDASPPSDHHNIKVKQSMPAKKIIDNPQQVADRLANLAIGIPQVNKATCVVIGNTAIVGIDINGNLESSRVGTIKYSVAEALRKDPYGVNAFVTADMDLYHRMREMVSQIRAGHPISGLANEFADIIGRIMPQVPSDIMPQGAEAER